MDPEILGQGVGAGIRKGDTALKEKLNAAIRSAAAAGDFERITKNYPELEKLIVLPQKEQD
jgi:polar amino acid transport system substrate-binding protein